MQSILACLKVINFRLFFKLQEIHFYFLDIISSKVKLPSVGLLIIKLIFCVCKYHVSLKLLCLNCIHALSPDMISSLWLVNHFGCPFFWIWKYCGPGWRTKWAWNAGSNILSFWNQGRSVKQAWESFNSYSGFVYWLSKHNLYMLVEYVEVLIWFSDWSWFAVVHFSGFNWYIFTSFWCCIYKCKLGSYYAGSVWDLST